MNQFQKAKNLVESLDAIDMEFYAGGLLVVVARAQNQAEYGGESDGSIDESTWNKLRDLADELQGLLGALKEVRLAFDAASRKAASNP